LGFVLYQGTTLVVPNRGLRGQGFSPCNTAAGAKAPFFERCFAARLVVP
jgi:hypothetical protein